jgi:ABC-2 type transport system ATP-binding protein
MKQKLGLSCALIHRPSVLFLDEPTTGVDAVSRKEFWDMLKKLKAEGITILVSTPYMDEASQCDRIALIQTGKLLSINSPKGVINGFERPLMAAKAANMLKLLNDLRSYELVEDVYPFGEYHHVVLNQDYQREQLMEFLQRKNTEQLELNGVEPDIEDCFIALMKN